MVTKVLYKMSFNHYWERKIPIIPSGIYLCNDGEDIFIGKCQGYPYAASNPEWDGMYMFFHPKTHTPVARYTPEAIKDEIDVGVLQLIEDEDYCSLLLTYL